MDKRCVLCFNYLFNRHVPGIDKDTDFGSCDLCYWRTLLEEAESKEQRAPSGGMMMSAITTQQVRKIYAIGNALGIVERDNDQDNLHILIDTLTGKESVKALGYCEAEDVIRELRRRQGDSPRPRPRRPKQHPETSGGATEGQQRRIWQLMYSLERLDREPSTATLGERLCGIIKRELKVDCTPKNPFLWLDSQVANKLIEIIKGYVKSAERR